MRLCGISSRFRLLSPCMRQVIHALLTRPPLSHKIFISEENRIKCFVRLACVKHAASVHPEPGSNSHVLSFSELSQAKYPCLPFGSLLLWVRLKSLRFLFQNRVRCSLLAAEFFSYESFKVISLFNFQGSSLLSFFATAL